MTATAAALVAFDHGAYEELETVDQEEQAAVKTLKAMGTPTWLRQLERRCNRSKSMKRVKLCSRDESGAVIGIAENLESSEHYCVTFGSFVAECWHAWWKESEGL